MKLLINFFNYIQISEKYIQWSSSNKFSSCFKTNILKVFKIRYFNSVCKFYE